MKNLFKVRFATLLGIVFFMTVIGNGNVSAQTNVQKAAGSVPFSKGVNFADWFETPNAESIMFSKYDEQDFIGVKKMGVDVIRLPIDMNAMTSGAPNYTVSPLLLKYLDQAVDWAEKNGLYIILDNHPLNMPPTPNDIDKVLIPVWTQMAQHYKNRSDYVLYEVMNEPNRISPQRWGKIQEDVIKVIRKIDQKHWIVAGCVEYDNIKGLSSLPKYTDNKLIYTFHFYEPELFTLSTDFPVTGVVPWPYDKNRMPKYNGSVTDEYKNYVYKNYEQLASQETLLKLLDMAVSFSRQRNAPVFCGEWGTHITSHNENGIRYHQFVSNALSERNISWTNFSYYGYCGMFNSALKEKDINSDLNVEMVKATGFTPPPQIPQTPVVPSTGFTIFDNTYPGDFFIAEFTYHGSGRQPLIEKFRDAYTFRWGNLPYKGYILPIIFKRITDLSNLVSAGYVLEIKACTDKPVSLTVRFSNPDNANSLSWRMGPNNIDKNMLPPDGNWHTIRIPLKSMQERGAWDFAKQQWISPRGEFSWKQIRSLDFAADDSDLKGCNVWIESIKIVAP